MDSGLQKTIVFLCFILIGVLLKTKFKTKDELNGIKKIILNLALPATIFIALLGIKIEWNLLFLPIMALVLNLFLFLLAPLLLPLVGVAKNTPEYKTARLLIPSLAPGLSCFPFVLEFLGDTALAKVAMADLGNKVFVLIFLYLVAMHWYFQNTAYANKKEKSNLSSLLRVLISEPVNLFIGAALLLLAFGITMDSLPLFLNNVLHKLSLIMTPLVLLFIGLGLKIKRKQFFQVFSLLVLRAGMVVLLCSVVILMTGLTISTEILLLLAFALSSCSFWPYAHISSVESLELDSQEGKRTFNSDFALTILALSFPLSTVLILGVLNTGTLFVSVTNVFGFGIVLMGLGLIYPLAVAFQRRVSTKISRAKMKSAATKHI